MKKYQSKWAEIVSRFFQAQKIKDQNQVQGKMIPVYVRTSDREEKPHRP